MGRPRKQPNEEATTERLLHAAEAEFAKTGFDGTRLGDIAAAVGISRPSLLYHYKSKQELYSAVVESVFSRLGAALLASIQVVGTFDERFDSLVRGFVEFVRSNPDFARVVLREVLDGKGPGRAILLDAGVPVLERIEAFIEADGTGILPGTPIRHALLEISSDMFVRYAASSELRAGFWGDEDHALLLARRLFFGS